MQSLALQADGKVLAGGNFTGYNNDLAAPDYLVRLNANGTRDTGFNSGGAGLTGFYVAALAVQADGKVLAGGNFTLYNGAAAPDNVLRLNANGSLDTGFNNGGAGANSRVQALVALPTGPVLVGGDQTQYNGNAAAPDYLLRLKPDGTLNDATTALAGATFVFNPGNTAGNTRTVTTAGSYTATATDPVTGCGFVSNAVVVTTPAPILSTLTPNTGVAGNTFAIAGTNLSGTTRISFTVVGGGLFAYAPAGFVVASNTSITGVTVPPGIASGAYTVTVDTPDGTSNGLTYTVPNQAPTALALSRTQIAENAGANATVGTFSTTDPDGADPHTYALVAGAGSADNGSFNIGGTGNDVLRLNVSADYETKNLYTIRVSTTDPGGLSFVRQFNIFINNVNEAPTISAQTRSIAENSPNGTAVGAPLTASDPNANTTLTYSITGGNGTGSGAFAFGSGGQLTVADVAQLDYETTPTFTLTVRVSDGRLTSSAAVTVNLTDVAEALVVGAGTAGNPVAIAPGNYTSITITGTGTATLTGPVSVSTGLTVQPGGSLNTACQAITGAGSFTLAAGATLYICDPNGLSNAPGTGAVQVTGTRTFDPDASYVYNGTTAQATGSGLPPQVRNLTSTNAQPLTLTTPTAVAQTLTLNAGNLALNGQALTLLSDASGTALVVNAGAGLVTGGTATVQRYLTTTNPGFGYRHYSSPVSGNSVSDLTTATFTPVVNPAYNTNATPLLVLPFPTVFAYEQGRLATTVNNLDSFSKGYVSPLALSDPLGAGRGYLVQLRGSEKVDFTGTLNAGPYSLALARNAGATAPDAGWALVGNPYPAPLDWSRVAPADRTNLDAAVYVYESTGPYTGNYRTVLPGAPGSGASFIGSSQGFFVRVSAGQTNGALTFRDAQRVTDYATQVPVRRDAADARPQLQLRLVGQGGADDYNLYAQAGASASLDAQYDAVKLPNSSGLNLAALTATGAALAIDGRPDLTTATAVPLQVDVPVAGSYTLTAATVTNLSPGTRLELVDNLTGQRTGLAAGVSYPFTSATTSTPGRFWLNLIPAGALATAGTTALALTLYPNPAHAAATVASLKAGAKVEVFDALGRRVLAATADANGVAHLTLPTGLPAGVYVVRGGGQTLRLAVE